MNTCVHQVNTAVSLGSWTDLGTVVKTVQHYMQRTNNNNNTNNIIYFKLATVVAVVLIKANYVQK